MVSLNESTLYKTSFENITNSSNSFLGGLLPCHSFAEPQHLLYNVANSLFLLSYLPPSSRRGLLFMHTVLIIGFLLYSTWAWNVICATDVFSWNFTFALLNMGQSLYILYQMRPVKIKKELETLYTNLFEPLQVPRILFKRLVSPEYAQTMCLHAGEAYALCKLTKTDRLGLLIDGKASVFSATHFLHSISAMEFLDSPEFESSRTSVEDRFRVSIIAVTSCRYLYWQRSSLEFFFVKEPYMSTIMSTLIARDITSKLYNMNQKILTERGSHLDIRMPSLTSSLSSVVGESLSKKPRRRIRSITNQKYSQLSLASSLPMLEDQTSLAFKSPDMFINERKDNLKRSPPPKIRGPGFHKLQNDFTKGIRPLKAFKHPAVELLQSPCESEVELSEEERNRQPLLEYEEL